MQRGHTTVWNYIHLLSVKSWQQFNLTPGLLCVFLLFDSAGIKHSLCTTQFAVKYYCSMCPTEISPLQLRCDEGGGHKQCAYDANRPQHMGVENLQLLLILLDGFLLAKDVSHMLMCATSELCVSILSDLVYPECFFFWVFFFWVVICETFAGNEVHPSIADEDKKRWQSSGIAAA